MLTVVLYTFVLVLLLFSLHVSVPLIIPYSNLFVIIYLRIGQCCGNICQHGALRLINGTTSNEGRLEICIYSVWGTVCHESFDTRDARVACRQLRYEVDNGQSKLHYSTDLQCV